MSDDHALQQALQKQQQDNPLDEVKKIRKEQLEQCAIKRHEELGFLLQEQNEKLQ